MEAAHFVSKFCVSFSWDFEEDWSVRDIQETIFNIIEDGDTRSQDFIVCSSVQSSGVGVLLTQPCPESDVVPCELYFRAHPAALECCITKIVIVSDAKNLELFVDDMYEKTTKGYMLTLKKGKKAPLYECEFDLSSHVQGNHKITVKFITGDKQMLKLQSVIVKVTRCSSSTPLQDMTAFASNSVDMSNVRKMMEEMGVKPPPGAEQMMQEIEKQQQVQSRQIQNVMTATMGMRLGAVPGCHDAVHQPQPMGRLLGNDVTSSPQINEISQSALANALLNEEKRKRLSLGNPPTVSTSRDRPLRQQPARPSSMPPNMGLDRGSSRAGLTEMLASFLQQDNRTGSPNTVVEGPIQHPASFPRASLPNNRQTASNASSARSSRRWSAAPGDQETSSVQVSSRPSSLSFSDTLERVVFRALNEPRDQPMADHSPVDRTRCQECGCPGCLSVYDSITTNVFAAEQRIMGKVDLKMQELLGHIDARFDALYDALLARQEFIATHLTQPSSGRAVADNTLR